MATLDPPPWHSPEGALDVKVDANGTANINGWMIDRSAIAAPVDGAVTVNGQVVRYFTANGSRPELANYGIPGNHGFAFTHALSKGTHNVCLYASNVGGGSDALIGCKTVSFNAPAVPPVGALSATGNGNATISVNGWAYDGSAPTEPVITVITTDGKDPHYRYGDGPRPELKQIFGWPGNHGFDFSYPVSTDGWKRVCMYMVDIGPGTLKEAECKTVHVTGNNPVGSMSVKRSGGVINVDGWAFDPSDLYANTTVMLTRNGQVVAYAAANGPRPELAYYGVPGNHGFTTSFAAGSGTSSVCLFVFNVGAGADAMVQCKNA